MLRQNHLNDIFFFGIHIVIVISVQEGDEVGVLFDLTAFAQVSLYAKVLDGSV
ncbi:hypothetical protein J2S21_004218 [Peribacillus cavernae]|nr:hypothetical protein [Peribacillus cavernae]